jgi:hypothetical protein
MLGLGIENRKLVGAKTLSGDLAVHIQHRYKDGKIAIVTDKPTALMSATCKQWQKIIRHVARERSSMLNPRKAELDEELARLKQVTFTAKLPIYDPQADVSFAAVEQFLKAPPICCTLYIACGIERHELYLVTSWMPPGGLVVSYGG